MLTTRYAAGRFGNRVFQNAAVSAVAQALRLDAEYDMEEQCVRLGMRLYHGKRGLLWDGGGDVMEPTTARFQEIIESPSKVGLPRRFAPVRDEWYQTPWFARYVREKSLRHARVPCARPDDVFVHLRLGDMSATSRSASDYIQAITAAFNDESASSGGGWARGILHIASDSPEHATVASIIAHFKRWARCAAVHVMEPNVDEVDTIRFGAGCGHIVLSDGTFSWLIGALAAKPRSVRYLPRSLHWHGDIFVFPEWIRCGIGADDGEQRKAAVNQASMAVATVRDYFTRVGYTPQLIFDVGAGDGARCVELLSAYPSARAVAFESSPEHVIVCRNAANVIGQRLRLIEGTVSDTSSDNFAIAESSERGTAPVFRLDAVCASLTDAMETRESVHADVLCLDAGVDQLAAVRSLGDGLARVQHVFAIAVHRNFADLDDCLRAAGFHRRDDVFPLDLVAAEHILLYSRPALPPLYDVVIPFHEKDARTLPRTLASVRRHAARAGKIFVISAASSDAIRQGDAAWIDESQASDGEFTLESVRAALPAHAAQRAGWYFQQLLKLYAWRGIPGIASKYLVLDSDTFLCAPLDFVDGEGRALLAVGDEAHAPYFEHMSRLAPHLKRTSHHSGIAHHMVFDTDLLQELMRQVAPSPRLPFWRRFLAAVDPAHAAGSGASEYEMYFHWVLAFAPHRVVSRRLRQRNVRSLDADVGGLDMASAHSYDNDGGAGGGGGCIIA